MNRATDTVMCILYGQKITCHDLVMQAHPERHNTLRYDQIERLRKTRRKGFTIFTALVGDESGAVPCLFFNQPFLKDVLRVRRQVLLFGVPVERRGGHGVEIQNPDYELAEAGGDKDSIHTGRLVPIHSRIDTLSPKGLRTILHDALHALEGPLPDPLPEEIRRRRRLIGREEALRQVHFPPENARLEEWSERRSPAHRRLASLPGDPDFRHNGEMAGDAVGQALVVDELELRRDQDPVEPLLRLRERRRVL